MTALIITPKGLCECLYTEVIDLSVLGTLTVVRATNIGFDNASQQWTVKDILAHLSRWEAELVTLLFEAEGCQPDRAF